MESKFATARRNATAIAKRYGECSEVLAFLGKRGRKTVRIVQNYGGIANKATDSGAVLLLAWKDRN